MSETYSLRDKEILLQKCLQETKDWLAHKKFSKKSGLVCTGEISRSQYPRGLQGWYQWRTQFVSKPGEDLRPVENALKRLYVKRELSQDEYARLRRLYGLELRTQATASSKFCMDCGNPVPLDSSFCMNCGASQT